MFIGGKRSASRGISDPWNFARNYADLIGRPDGADECLGRVSLGSLPLNKCTGRNGRVADAGRRITRALPANQ